MQLNDVAQLIKLLDKSSLTEIQFSDENSKVVLKKELPAIMTQASMPMMVSHTPQGYAGTPQIGAGGGGAPSEGAATSTQAPHSKFKDITSPMVGTFYASSTPGTPAFLSVGTQVKPGQVICIIEAMKIMNEIECDVSGIVEEVCVSNETPVEYGSVLFRIRPA
jgi:acetyl-CoA carboxylase biotin carboxyl carrier protein